MIISEYLQKNKMTQREFATEIGCTTAFVNSIINGKNTDIKISLLRKISDRTKISETKLITELLSFKPEAQVASGKSKSR